MQIAMSFLALMALVGASAGQCLPQVKLLRPVDLGTVDLIGVPADTDGLMVGGVAPIVSLPSYLGENPYALYYEVPRNVVNTGSKWELTCPSGCGLCCTFYFFHYHCPGCGAGISGGWWPRLVADGWAVRGNCVPRFQELPDVWPQRTAVYRKRVEAGETETTVGSVDWTKWSGWFAVPCEHEVDWCTVAGPQLQGEDECKEHCCVA